jgi:hypothetical protein
VLEAAELRENEGNEDLRHEAAVQIRDHGPIRHCRIPPRRRLTATAPPGRTPPSAPPHARSMRLRVFAATKRNRVGARRRGSQPPCLQRSSLDSPADSPPLPPPQKPEPRHAPPSPPLDAAAVASDEEESCGKMREFRGRRRMGGISPRYHVSLLSVQVTCGISRC